MIENDERKDKALFDRIALKYALKDEVESSRIARKFQLLSLMDHVSTRKARYGNILEIGCGVGASAEYLEGRFDTYIGVDYSDNLIALAKKKYEIDKVAFKNINVKNLDSSIKYDVIFGVGVLHHVDNCEEVLKGLRTFAKPDALIAFVEPQRGNPFIQLLRRVRKITDKDYSEDQHFFSKRELLAVFEAAGYHVERIEYQGYFSPPFAQVIMSPQLLFKWISKFTIGLDRFIQKKLNNVFSWNIVVVASLK